MSIANGLINYLMYTSFEGSPLGDKGFSSNTKNNIKTLSFSANKNYRFFVYFVITYLPAL